MPDVDELVDGQGRRPARRGRERKKDGEPEGFATKVLQHRHSPGMGFEPTL